MLGSSTYHEASARLGGRHLTRSGDLAGDQSLEFLQLLEQGPEEGMVVTRGNQAQSHVYTLASPKGACPAPDWVSMLR